MELNVSSETLHKTSVANAVFQIMDILEGCQCSGQTKKY